MKGEVLLYKIKGAERADDTVDCVCGCFLGGFLRSTAARLCANALWWQGPRGERQLSEWCLSSLEFDDLKLAPGPGVLEVLLGLVWNKVGMRRCGDPKMFAHAAQQEFVNTVDNSDSSKCIFQHTMR